MPRATFSGRLVVGDEQGPPFYRFNFIERQVYFSAFHLSPRNAAAYVEPLRRHRIRWGTGYSHAWEQLALMMIEQGIPAPPDLRAIITTSEKLTASGRQAIERAFGCKAYQEYGTVEDAVWACEQQDGLLRHSPDSGIVELRRPDGSIIPVGEPGEGEVVATSFIRRSQLFIRYRVGDVAAWAPGHEDMPAFSEVVGRLEDVVEAPDGRRTVRFHGVFTEVPGVREAQVIQEALDRVRLKVVPSPSYGEATVRELEKRIHDRLTRAVTVIVEPVDEIPRTKAGKFQAVVSLLRRPAPDEGSARRP
jgi:phenylacetate-CoA ligase